MKTTRRYGGMEHMTRMSDLEACFDSREALGDQLSEYRAWLIESGLPPDHPNVVTEADDVRMLVREWAFDWAHSRGHDYPGLLADRIERQAIAEGWIK